MGRGVAVNTAKIFGMGAYQPVRTSRCFALGRQKAATSHCVARVGAKTKLRIRGQVQ